MLCFFKHENVLSALDILQPPHLDFFQEIYVITELLQSDLHKVIVSHQPLSSDHIKVFLYQILRGLKYLHSARILHRDIKPGNLLVNSNCVLKICDFGLARVEEPDSSKAMTQEVVTQYYRAPEILMGAKHYSAAVDVWSVGCIFGELLGRRILFQAQNPVQQLELITELLGTPSLEDMKYACEGAKSHMLRRPPKPPSLSALYTLSSQATHEVVHLLCQMLVFDPDKRISVTDALAHPYLDEGRLRYHSCMCKCCYTTASGMRQYTSEFETTAPHPFDDHWEKKLTSIQQVKVACRCASTLRARRSRVSPGKSVHHTPTIRPPFRRRKAAARPAQRHCIANLCAIYHTDINMDKGCAPFKKTLEILLSPVIFLCAASTVAHPSELPPSPHQWEAGAPRSVARR
ncbi:unnamed protein product [Acanthoscelides obtectus]|uniref:Serine/threonine kinase NLK n=1 Tax=Acanthoscelides obtectus TaxID=200917 RepID=A0A9P0PJE9_ACAOB|nr:unnamed protein product [Acanthoscelides obtectus]CAK1619837.1 Serine/threonine-protein kinase NLK [Acanthoscelides obtectus]